MIAIFTPTYNRKSTLRRCYDSLEKQTRKDFEWLVVDDGSVDETKKYIQKLQEEAAFKITYIHQKNGGKHRAFNRAVQECNQEYMLLLDSDDMLTPNAIEILSKRCKIIKKRQDICGIIGNDADITTGKIIGKKMPKVKFASGLELYQKLGFRGDTMRLYKTEVLKEFPFPEVEGEKFMSENVIYDKIDQKYKMLVIPEVIYLCEYQEGGLSNNLNCIRFYNPIGSALSLKSTAETALTLKKKIGVTTIYIMWTRRFHIKNAFRDFKCKFIYLLCYPVSLAFELVKYPKFYFNILKEGEK